MNQFIVIEGNIGAGKTSFVSRYSKEFGYRVIYEQFAENAFLPKFYQEPEKYAFTLEMSFLANRFHQLKKELNRQDIFSSGIISDYYLMKSLIFARATLSTDEFKLYRDIFDIIYQRLPKPDKYEYLHKTPESLLKNIYSRGRAYERNINWQYLKKIEDSYFTFFKQHVDLKPLIINTDELDFVKNDEDFYFVCEKIKSF